MISLQQDYITNEVIDTAYAQRSLREDLRDLVLTGVSGLSVLDQQTQLTPVRDYNPYRTTEFPDVLSIPLTEKLAPVYAPTSYPKPSKTGISLPYVSDNWQLKETRDVIIDYADNTAEYKNTVVTNPAVLPLETVPVYSGSTLEANYQQLPATLSGQDSMLVPMMNAAAQQTVDDSPLVSTSTTESECWIPGVTSGCWLRKDVRNESMVFIIGAIVLALGIFALTR